jgi:hypothetical protein
MDLEPEDPEGGGDVALWEEVHEISEVGEDDVDRNLSRIMFSGSLRAV